MRLDFIVEPVIERARPEQRHEPSNPSQRCHDGSSRNLATNAVVRSQSATLTRT
jgi:hypothetical protein